MIKNVLEILRHGAKSITSDSAEFKASLFCKPVKYHAQLVHDYSTTPVYADVQDYRIHNPDSKIINPSHTFAPIAKPIEGSDKLWLEYSEPDISLVIPRDVWEFKEYVLSGLNSTPIHEQCITSGSGNLRHGLLYSTFDDDNNAQLYRCHSTMRNYVYLGTSLERMPYVGLCSDREKIMSVDAKMMRHLYNTGRLRDWLFAINGATATWGSCGYFDAAYEDLNLLARYDSKSLCILDTPRDLYSKSLCILDTLRDLLSEGIVFDGKLTHYVDALPETFFDERMFDGVILDGVLNLFPESSTLEEIDLILSALCRHAECLLPLKIDTLN